MFEEYRRDSEIGYPMFAELIAAAAQYYRLLCKALGSTLGEVMP